MKYWLMKSEPEVYSIEDLQRDTTTWWGGVRNYQARNFMVQEMKVGDQVLFYHSNANPSGIAGLATVSSPAAPDATAQDEKSEYFDPKATKKNPIWFCVQVKFRKSFKRIIALDEIRENPALAEMLVLKRGQRLSIQPVDAKHFQLICKLAEKEES